MRPDSYPERGIRGRLRLSFSHRAADFVSRAGDVGYVAQTEIVRMNNWNIPEWMEKKIIARDLVCVYCGTLFTTPEQCRKTSPSW